MKDTEIKKIIEDMKAAGCGSADTDRVMRMHEAGMDEEILVCLRKIRRTGNQADPANSYR